MKKRMLILFLCLLSIFILTSCGSKPNTEHLNLQKLCKVWGFAKYTHPAFLTGQMDWDAELLKLMPIVHNAGEKETNSILFEWFTGLGYDGYGSLGEDSKLANIDDSRLHFMANMDWINAKYLGEPLAAVLSRFQELPNMDRSAAPVSFDYLHNSAHSNEMPHDNMDYSDTGYRLLGLFRLWNAINYYFPYLDIIDYDWNDLLLEYIPIMLDGTDKASYESTLASLADKLDDAHIFFSRTLYSDIRRSVQNFWRGIIPSFNNERFTQAQNRYDRLPPPAVSHMLLENNIGLINASRLVPGDSV